MLIGYRSSNHPQQVVKRGPDDLVDDRATHPDFFAGIGPWVAKAWEEWERARGIVLLLPANRTEQNWWHEAVEPFRDRAHSPLSVEFLKGRTRFLRPGQDAIGPKERPPFGCCLLIWRAT